MEQKLKLSELAVDTLKGLSANSKFLYSKYFYDDIGSAIFQDIMKMPEYYLTDCEQEIFASQKDKIIDRILDKTQDFEIFELGPGDGLKSKLLLKTLVKQSITLKYIPIDISKKANSELVQSLSIEIPGLKVQEKTGDFFKVMKQINGFSGIRKVVLFLGSNIGNFSENEINNFLKQISEFTHCGDKVLIGFDLKKSPEIVLKAYDDPHGFTRDFTLNHLSRLNRELGAEFDLSKFKHHITYNPESGAVKNYLVSTVDQNVYVGALEKSFAFKKWETIDMELSQKFDFEMIENYAAEHKFKVLKNFTDKRDYFVDSLWERV